MVVPDFVNHFDFDETAYLSYISSFYPNVSMPFCYSMYKLWLISVFHGEICEKRSAANCII